MEVHGSRGRQLNEFIETAVAIEINKMVANEEIFGTPLTCTMYVIDKNKLMPFIDESYLKPIKPYC